MLPSEFLSAAYAGVSEGFVPITSLSDHRSEGQTAHTTWFALADSPDWTQVDSMVAVQKDSLFWHPGIRRAIASGRGRGSVADVSGVVCLWLDIDLESKASKKRYPSREMALDALRRLDLAPSVATETGGGLHAYWLLDGVLEPVLGASIAKRWEVLFGSLLPAGRVIDHVSNIDRMMRLPGSMNLKYRPANMVSVIGGTQPGEWVRYSYRDILGSLDSSLHVGSNGRSNGNGRSVDNGSLVDTGVVLDGDWERAGADVVKEMRPSSTGSSIVQEHVRHLLEDSPEFSAIWHHKKNIGDKSQSGWDLEICRFLVRSPEYRNREYARLFCLENRRIYDANPKKMQREDYSQNTWATALRLEADRGSIPPAPAAAYKRDYELLTDYFGPEVTEVLKYGADDAGEFVLRFANGAELSLGTVDQWSTQSRMRNIVLGRMGGIHKPMKKQEWEAFCHSIVSVAVVVHADELSFVRDVAAYAQEYAGGVSELCEDTRATQIGMGRPVMSERGLGISLTGLMKHIAQHEKRVPSRPSIIRALESCGFERHRLNGTTGNNDLRNKQSVKRWYWFIDPKALESVVAGEPAGEPAGEAAGEPADAR